MSPLLAKGALYFLAGCMREVLTVLYYRAVSKKRDYSASGLAGGIELYDFVVLASVIQSEWDPLLLGCYVVGVVIGTFTSIRWSK